MYMYICLVHVGASLASGLLYCRFQHSSVVVTAPKKLKRSGRELQLPSMTLLTSKSSNQQFFLRILKVIIQLRDATKSAAKKAAGGQPL